MSTTTNAKTWNIALWIAQILMAGMFGMAGFAKLTTPIAELAASMSWVNDTPVGLVRFIGLAELLGAIGLILPAALRIMPKLTNYAALGLTLVMVLAAAFHLYRGEYSAVPVNIVLIALLLFINWGRNSKAVIPAKA